MKKSALVLALIGAASAGAASAEDFTFTVPVAVSLLPPSITSMDIACGVITDAAHGGRLIGHATVTEPITGGGFSGDVVVAFNATLPEERALAASYNCEINRFVAPYGTAGGGARVYYPGNATTRPELFFPLATGAAFVTSTGYLPLH
ncbi:MAG TPA: hypothetical protein VNH64_08670 [Parvularculaceae bacterium]|nr:hypothetical protein [Parvularculaceae bacterium]